MVSSRAIESGGKVKNRGIESREAEETVMYRRVENSWDPPCQKMRSDGDGFDGRPDAELGEIEIESIQHHSIGTIIPNESGK